jgi:hypothetical protein
MGFEGSWLLAFSLPLTLPISLMNFNLKGSFGQERKRHRDPWKNYNQRLLGWNTKPHLKLFFPFGFPR